MSLKRDILAVIASLISILSFLAYLISILNGSVPISTTTTDDGQQTIVYFKFIDQGRYYILDYNDSLHQVGKKDFEDAQIMKPARIRNDRQM